MLDLQKIKSEYQSLLNELSSSDLDPKNRAALQKKISEKETLINILERKESLDSQASDCKILLTSSSDDEIKELANLELVELKEQLKLLEKELEDFYFPPDPRNNKSCFIEIRAGAGGLEASLFVLDLLKMYLAFCLKKGIEASVQSVNSTDVGGAREAVLYLKGKGAFGNMKFESGVHRVQRVPTTEGAGRVHTSTVTVAVMAEADEVDVKINPNDLRIDTFRSSGAGGQHVNTTDSAIRITHIPTGVVVSCQDERSQLKNKNKALKELRSRILESEREKAASERKETRKKQVGSGDRCEKIRTYNYPQNRVTDHRVGLTLKKLDIVMQGELEEIIDSLKEQERKERIEASKES